MPMANNHNGVVLGCPHTFGHVMHLVASEIYSQCNEERAELI